MNLLYNDERLINNPKIDSQIQNEHKHRYKVAALFAKGKRVLDAACGSGYGSAILAEVAERVVGIDYCKDVIEYCNGLYRSNHLTYQEMSAGKLDFPENSFDVVVSFETIEHLTKEDQVRFLEGIKKVLTDDGILIMSSPNKNVWETMVNGENNAHHLNELNKKQFQELLGIFFSNITLFHQNCLPVSFILPENETSTPIKKILSENYTDAEYSSYCIAVCSNQPIDVDLSSLYVSNFEQTHFEKNFGVSDMSLYCDCGNGFVEENKIHSPIHVLEDGKIEVRFVFKKNTKSIRLDPGELPCLLKDFSVSDETLVCTPFNGVLEDGDFKFFLCDPIIAINGRDDFREGDTLSFSFYYQNIHDETVKSIKNLQNQSNALAEELTALKTDYQNNSNLLSKINAENKLLLEEKEESNRLIDEKSQKIEQMAQSYSSLAKKYLTFEQNFFKAQETLADAEVYFSTLLQHKDDFFTEVVTAKDEHITNIETTLSVLNDVIAEKDVHISNIEAILATLNKGISEKDTHITNLEAMIHNLNQENALCNQKLDALQNSFSWKLTAPLRKIKEKLGGLKKHV